VNWKGRRVLITAGPTREYLDPVRYISNESSGRMGYALARAAKRLGARVVLVSGPTSLRPPSGIILERVVTAEEMHKKTLKHFSGSAVVIGAAAVGDFKASKTAGRKIKKKGGRKWTLSLIPTADILADLGRRKDKNGLPIIVAFALETERLIENAKEKLKRKRADMIVANGREALGAVRTRLTIIRPGAQKVELPPMGKLKAAGKILKHAGDLYDAC